MAKIQHPWWPLYPIKTGAGKPYLAHDADGDRPADGIQLFVGSDENAGHWGVRRFWPLQQHIDALASFLPSPDPRLPDFITVRGKLIGMGRSVAELESFTVLDVLAIAGTNHDTTARGRLTGKAKAMADMIDQNYAQRHEGTPGKQIAKAIDTTEQNVRNMFGQKLRALGYRNAQDGEGYLPPADVT